MDGALIERARKGDADAFDELARLRIDALYATTLAILGNPADARDATQEALISAWRSLGSLRDTSKLDAWLYRIAVNAARMVGRRRRALRVVRPIEEADARLTSDPAASAFDAAFLRLTIDQRALLVAHHLDGVTVAELGERLGIPAGTVKSRLFAARSALDQALREDS